MNEQTELEIVVDRALDETDDTCIEIVVRHLPTDDVTFEVWGLRVYLPRDAALDLAEQLEAQYRLGTID
jgi:hypothetical protein